MLINHQLSEIDYRQPICTESHQVQAFFYQTLNDNFHYFPSEAHSHYKKSWEISLIEKRILEKKDLLLCAWSNKQIVGLVSGTPTEGGVGTIIWLTIDPSWQNKKIGAALLAQAKDYYRTLGAHKLKLTVHDKKAVDFYQREGLMIEATHINHWWKLNFWAMACFI